MEIVDAANVLEGGTWLPSQTFTLTTLGLFWQGEETLLG